jgi:hypothetical protein
MILTWCFDGEFVVVGGEFVVFGDTFFRGEKYARVFEIFLWKAFEREWCGDERRQIQGSFAALRMTTSIRAGLRLTTSNKCV